MSRLQAALQRRQRQPMEVKSIPAPIGGWVTAQNLAASAPNTCIVLDNFRPTSTGLVVRGGNKLHATVSAVAPTESLMGYVGATVHELFASAGGSIYDITSVVNPAVPPAADVTGRTSNYYAHVNFATTGGYFMYAVNGTDLALLYNGTTWTPINAASTPAITGATTSSFSHVNVYRNRLYFVKKNDLIVYYLPVDSIGGAAAQLSLSGVFHKGGAVYFTATWSSESGSASMNDYLVVMSTEGEAAIYQGSFPGGTDWGLVGVYDLARPLGINAWFKAGGDIIVLTETGEIPISAARYKDPAALSMDAVSKNIEPDWRREAAARRTVPWEVVKWNNKGAYYVNVPVVSGATPPVTFVGNLQTGAICRYTGWDTRCLLESNGQLYFGCNDGSIRLAEVSGYDKTLPYTAVMGVAWDHMGAPMYRKTMRQARAEFRTTSPFSFVLNSSVDYISNFPVPPAVMADLTPNSLWDVGLWGAAVWDANTAYLPKTTRWQSIGQSGDAFSMQLQIPVGSVNTPTAELTIITCTYETGGLVV